jgi:hypothetical protein
VFSITVVDLKIPITSSKALIKKTITSSKAAACCGVLS